MKQVVIILLTIALFFGAIVISSDYVTEKQFEQIEYYVLPDDTVKIINYTGKEQKVIIPDTIEGKKVSSITEKSVGFEEKNGEKVPIENFIINGYYGTAAQLYAEKEGILFNCLHKFKSEVIKETTYSQKGSRRNVCACGFTFVEEIDYKKIPDIKFSSATPDGDGIVFTWNKIDGISNYNIYRSVNGGDFENVATIKGNEFVDYESDSASLKYYITGKAGKNEGAKDIAPVSLDYFKSPNLSLDSSEDGILLNWGDSKNAVRYRVYKKDENNNYNKIYETVDSSEKSYLDKDVNKQSEYFYSVVAVDKNGRESAKSSKGKSLVFGKHTKVVYLTFDDGPSENTLKVLKILKRYNAKATFFVTAFDKSEYMKNIVEEGHTIGLHTYSHDYGKIYSSTSAYFKDLEKIGKLVYDKTGVNTKIIRFPGGASNTISASYSKGIMSKLTNMVEDRGYKYFDWNVNSGDADGQNVSAEKILANVKRESSGVSNCVVLMHDTAVKNTTVKALDSICAYYKEQGYEFAGLTVNSLPCHQTVNN